MPAAPTPARAWHPLLLVGVSLIGVRALGLVLHFVSRDPDGNAVSASPLLSMGIAGAYHGTVVLALVAGLLAAWKLLRPLRPAITAGGVALCLAAGVLGQVDLGLQWFTGRKLTANIVGTYGGEAFFSSDVYAPLLHHPVYLATGLGLMLTPWAALAWNGMRLRNGLQQRRPGWSLVLGLAVAALLCRYPVRLAHGHQRDVLRPPELVLAYGWLRPSTTPAVRDEARAVAELRALVDPSGAARWLDPRLPLVRAGGEPPNPHLTNGDAPAERELPDILLFALESLRGADVGFVPGNYGPGEASPTPRLDALAREGVVFAHHISTGNPSPRGYFSLNVGVWDHRDLFIVSRWTATEFDALPLRLRRRGYRTLGVWASDPSFDNQYFWAKRWFDDVRYPAPQGRLYIRQALADDVVMDRLIEGIRDHDRAHPGQPFYAYLYNSGTHEPYVVQGATSLPPDSVAAINGEPDARLRYRRVLRHLDAQVGRVLDFLARRPPGRPLLVIVTGDHSDLAGDTVPPEMFDMPHNPSEWTSAIMAGPPELVGPPRVETFPSSHVDFFPTILRIVGDHDPLVTMGTDLFADIPPEDRTAVSGSGRGFRLDRDGWSLFVLRDREDGVWTKPAWTSLADLRRGVEGSPFTEAEARRLRQGFDTWSWLIEHDRVWRETWRTGAVPTLAGGPMPP